jgi:hypothetical protein
MKLISEHGDIHREWTGLCRGKCAFDVGIVNLQLRSPGVIVLCAEGSFRGVNSSPICLDEVIVLNLLIPVHLRACWQFREHQAVI